MLTLGEADDLDQMCTQRKTAFTDYKVELNVDPNVLRTRMFPYYCFDVNMEFWEKISAFVKESNSICYAFLTDFLWKTQNNVMWPNHLPKGRLKQARNRVIKILDQVPDDVILSYKGIDNF